MDFKNFWISPALSSKTKEFTNIILKLNKEATPAKSEGDQNTLHIAPIDEVISNFSSNLLYISDQCLLEIDRKGIDNLNFLKTNNQCVNLCLSNFCITSTGFSSDSIKEIAKKIILLGGKYQRSFQDDITLVIAARSASQKVYSASSFHIPIVKVEWIDTCFKNFVQVPFDQYQIMPFFGCTFTSTDLLPKQNNKISEIIKKCEGKLIDKFDRSTTFLVSQTLCNTPKIQLALKENVPIVKPEWIFRCENSHIISPIDFTLNWWCMCDEQSDLFKGISFGLSKEIPDRRTMIDIIIAHSGSYEERPNYFLTTSIKRDQTNKDSILITPRWILTCVSEKRLIDPNESPTFSPFPFSTKIEGIVGRSFFLSNLQEDRRHEYADLLRTFGATVFFKFSKRANIIIAETINDNTFSLAKEYSIPIVSISWIVELARTGIFPDIESHKLKENKTSINFRQICQKIKRELTLSESKSSNSTLKTQKTQYQEINLDQLESYTQQSSNDKIKITTNEVGYDAQENVEIQVNSDFDPFLAAFNNQNQL